MKAADRIRKELTTIMSEGQANACRIWKGWDQGGHSYGWWYEPFNGVAMGLGFSADEAVECIRDLREQQLQDAFDATAPPLESSR